MSAIFGIINLDGRPAEPDLLHGMAASLACIGPDGKGLWHEGPASLGHLLTTYSPYPKPEILPLTNETDNLVISADAELDNRKELLEGLDIGRNEGTSLSDAALILKAWQKWGEVAPEKFLGSFAFAVWDKREQSLFCVRDHIGTKPLFYHYSSRRFIFSTMIRGIRLLPYFRVSLDEESLAASIYIAPKNRGNTFYREIKRLDAATVMVIKGSRMEKRRYWEVPTGRRTNLSGDDYAEALRELMTEVVHCRIRNGHPAGVMLSGGLDSSAIACIAAGKLREEGKTLIAAASVLPELHEGIEKNDRPYIKKIIEQEQNIDIRYVTATGLSPFDGLEEKFNFYDSPVNGFHYMDDALASALALSGVKTVLTGMDGDTLASYDGRDTLARLFEQMQWKTLFSSILQLRKKEGESLGRIARARMFPYLLPWLHLKTAYLRNGEWRSGELPANSPASPAFLTKFATQFGDMEKDEIRLRQDFLACNLSKRLRSGSGAAEYFGINHLMQGMSCASPFLDRRIVEFVMTVPPEHFLSGGRKRGLFRQAMKHVLPEEVRLRRGKSPYSPDFHSRIIAVKKETKQFIEKIRDNRTDMEYIGQYLDIDRISRSLDLVQPVKGQDDWYKVNVAVPTLGIITMRFLLWIKS